jgi:WD repeat-containing protein 6
VTALAFYRSSEGSLLVLAGEGCYLKVFDALKSTLIGQCKIFSAQTVHGIAVSELEGRDYNIIKAAFWGGKSFVLLGIEELEAVVRGDVTAITASERAAPDWILDGAISPFPGSPTCIFVTAHSVVLRATKDDSYGKTILKVLPSLSRSILYSAHVLWTGSGSIMVAGGTVFGEVEVSEWQQIGNDCPIHCRHLFNFTGHEGSVFGVRISPKILGPDGNLTRYLASCSDDRTIRIWDLSMSMGEQELTNSDVKLGALNRDTGFRENHNTSVIDTPAKRCIAVKMAHASRIWRVDFIAWNSSVSDFPTKVHVLSFGEDSTCQQWTIDFLESNSELGGTVRQDLSITSKASVPRYPAILTHVKTFSYHTGKHVWSTALSFVSDTSRRLVTGGADGKVPIYDIFLDASGESSSTDAKNLSSTGEMISEQQNPPPITRSWTLDDILYDVTLKNQSSEEITIRAEKHVGILQRLETVNIGSSTEVESSQKAQTSRDAPNRYGFVGENELLLTTSLGRIVFVSIRDSYKWEELDLQDNVRNSLKSYCLLLGLPAFGIALLAGANGTIYLYHKKIVTELMKVKGKPAALLNVSISFEERLGILITTLGNNEAHHLSITTSTLQPPILEKVISIELPSGFIVTGAGNVTSFLILGGRNGLMALYDLESSKKLSSIMPGREAQGDDAITCIVAVPSPNSQADRCHFLTTSRDGSYSIFSLSTAHGTDDSSGKVLICLVHRAFPPLGPMIEAALFKETGLILYGFRGTSFIVWDETNQFEVSSVECGGGHRSYAYMPGTGKGGAGHFAFTKASRIYIHSQAYPSHRTLKPGGHGREIKSAAIHKDLIATGAEDTTIRVWRIRKKGGERQRVFISVDGESGRYGKTALECCAVLESHTTGIQHLQWCCSSDDYHSLFSAAGAEEFHVWAVSDIPGFGLAATREATLTDLSEDRDLRIMGFDVEFTYDSRPHKKANGDSNGKNKITLIYSDSTIKCYDYIRTTGFTKTAEGKYTSACLTQVVCLRESLALPKFFTAATDGHLALWERSQRGNTGRHTFGIPPISENPAVSAVVGPELILKIKLHQSSISALAIQHLTLLRQRGGLLVATIGDDNAICITFFHYLTPTKRMVIPSAHAAGITGLAFKSDVTGGESEDKWVQLWTVGGDQRVKRWTVELGLTDEDPKPTMENGLNMRVWGQDESDDVWSSVADPGGLVEWRDNWEESHALVYGNGMEVFKLEDGFPDGVGMRWVGIQNEEPKQEAAEDDVEVTIARHNILSI